MAFVYDHEEIIREVVEEAEGALADWASVKIPGVVFDAAAVAQFADHLEVERDAVFETFGFEVAADFLEVVDLFYHVFLYGVDGILLSGLTRDEDVGGEDGHVFVLLVFLPGRWFDGGQFFHLIAEETNAVGNVHVSRKYIYRITLYAEGSPFEFCTGAGV